MENKLGQEYNQSYYEAYDVGDSKVSYEHCQALKDFMAHVADAIVEQLHPKTVLDAGCAMGFLVEALRDRGVEAYGMDISEYAISRVREDIKPYCWVQSATQPLPEERPAHYDLITTIEVIEHLSERDGALMIQNLTRYTDDILFSSTPDVSPEPTHSNVQYGEYWAKRFAENGFYKDVFFDAGFISDQAVRFQKKEGGVQLIEDYEKAYRLCRDQQKALEKRAEELEKEVRRTMDEMVDLTVKNKGLAGENEYYAAQMKTIAKENEKSNISRIFVFFIAA